MKTSIKSLILILIFLLSTSATSAQTLFSTSSAPNLVDIQKATVNLRSKEKELTDRELELNAREQRLNALEQDLVTSEDRLNELRAEINERLAQLNSSNDEDLTNLAKLYGSTKAKQTAAIMAKMEVAKSAALLRKIGTMTSGKIMGELSKLDPTYAAKLTSLMVNDPLNLEDISNAVDDKKRRAQ